MPLSIHADFQTITSAIDGSINNVYSDGSEFRLVRREDHDTLYLSSFTGCGLGCIFCHLTTTGQTKMTPLSSGDMFWRIQPFILSQSKRLNFAFMARGDALANPQVNGALCARLLAEGPQDVPSKVTISTIFPETAKGFGPKDDICATLFGRFGPYQPSLYWSLYTLDKEKRRVLMPNAADPIQVAEALARWQAVTMQEVIIHHSLIEGVNDALREALEIEEFLYRHHLKYRVNLVRYNPPDATTREARDLDYQTHLGVYNTATAYKSKIQPRVGFDAKCSCGMFHSDNAKGDQA